LPFACLTPPLSNLGAARDYVRKNAATLVTRPGFNELSPGQLYTFVSTDKMQITERAVFNACLAWATARCVQQDIAVSGDSLRAQLGDILHQIRFPVLDLEFLTSTVMESKLITQEQLISFITYVSTPEADRDEKSVAPFVGHVRDPFRTDFPVPLSVTTFDVGRTLQISFTWDARCEGWSVNFRRDPAGDILFHFNPRRSEMKVVRNALTNGSWGAEERIGGWPFAATNSAPVPVTLEFQHIDGALDVRVNDVVFCRWRWRSPARPLLMDFPDTGLSGAKWLIS